MTDLQIMDRVRAYIAGKGYTCAPGLVENYYLSLKSRPFVLLAGYGDTDLARLPALFAGAVGATAENGRYLQLTVRSDWMDSSDLFGCLNLAGDFVPGPVIDFLKAAQKDPERPYFLCLDRIILSRAEYYLRELLQSVESRQTDTPKPLVTMAYYGRDSAAAAKYGEIPSLGNLYIIGTLNMDEASRPLNQQLLDRVHTMEYPQQALVCTGENTAPDPVAADNGFLETVYLRLEQCPMEQRQVYFSLFDPWNKILSKANAYLGFRLRNDAILYLMHNRDSRVLSEAEALDHVLAHKVLTRVQGSSKTVLPVLRQLQTLCAGYPKTAGKLEQMIAQCEADGFTSFWG